MEQQQQQRIDDENEQIMRLLSTVDDYNDDILGNIQHYQESMFSYSLDDDNQYVYNDCDNTDKEICEIYSYSENGEHLTNYKAFEQFLNNYKYKNFKWQQFNYNEKIDIILKLNNQLEINDKHQRLKIYQCTLYIAQGCWNFIETFDELINEQKTNAILLYRYGIFENLIKILNLETNCTRTGRVKRANLRTTQRLRRIFSILCTIIEVIRNDDELIENLKYDLLNPENNEFLVVTLFNMIVDFIDNIKQYSHYPIKKILILLWKTILIMLGDLNCAKEFKCEQRKKYDLIDDHDRCVENKQSKGKLRPKLNQQNYTKILNKIRMKYIGFCIDNDTTTLTGLPDCIIESITILQKHLYTPLSDKHMEQERLIDKHYNKVGEDYDLNPIELLYQALLPKLSNYIGALTRIFFQLQKSDNLTGFIGELLPTKLYNDAMESTILTRDTCRHKEIISKAITSILLLFLKHFKNNHYYQFECLCNVLIKEKFINVIIRFLHQDLRNYLDTPNEINMLEFQFYTITRFDKLYMLTTTENFYAWRQLHIWINVLRILNKIVKRKPQHIEFLIKHSTYNDLKQHLRIRNRMLQYYSMKLMKLQIPYLKKPWINANLRIINGIYQHVRYHLLDDFLKRSTDDLNQQPIYQQKQLQIAIEKFHKRRYNYYNNNININKNADMDYEDDYQPVDNCLQSVLGQHMQLCPIFKQHYEIWLDYNVFKQNPDRFIV